MRDVLTGDTNKPFGDGRCAAPNCVSSAKGLMCRPHWNRVPLPLRRKVLLEWALWLDDSTTLEKLRAAQFAAIDALAER